MTHIAPAAHSVLASLGYRVEAGDDAFAACYLGAGAALPVAWVRADGNGWLVAIAKHVVPKLVDKSLTGMATDRFRPDGAAFVVPISDRHRLYGVFELIATAYMRRPLRPSAQDPANSEACEVRPSVMLLTTLDRLLDEAAAGQTQPTTVISVLRDARVGQDRFRAALLAHWGNACAVTSLNVVRLLRASHCKPWAVSNAKERLDPSNGLLLAAHLDAAFDAGYISFADDGRMLSSPQLDAGAVQALGLRAGMRLRQIQTSHRIYLQWHRTHVFLNIASPPIDTSQ